MKTINGALILCITVVVAVGCREIETPTAPRELVGITPPRFSIVDGVTTIDLGTLGGFSWAEAVNENGQAVGRSSNASGKLRAFLWSESDGMRDLGTNANGEGESVAFDINDSGAVVGWSATLVSTDNFPFLELRNHAFVWSDTDGFRDLGTLGGRESAAHGINNAGAVVGWSRVSGEVRAFLWTAGEGMQNLGTLGESSVAWAINDAGMVTGTYVLASALRAFVWTEADGMRDIGTLGGDPTIPRGINDDGAVVGVGRDASGNPRAFLWTEAEGMRDLGTLGGAIGGAADVNDGGTVVGHATNGSGHSRLFIWTETGGMYDVGVGGDFEPRGVNDRPEIVGRLGSHAVLWRIEPTDATPGFTPTGFEVVVSPTNETTGEPSVVTITFEEVTASGETTVATSGTGAPPPESFRLGSPPVYYEIDTTATFEGSVEVCIDYSGQSFPNEQNLRLMHDDGSGWVDVTSSHDAENDVICGVVDSLSPFVIFQANTTPVASVGGPYGGDEGGTVTLSLSGGDEDGDALAYSWDLGDGTTGSGTILPADHIYADDGVYTVSLTANDEFGGSHTATTAATIANVAPLLGEITAPVDPQPAVTSVAIGSTYSDAGVLDTHTATIDWNDGSPAEVIDVSDGSVAASHTYTAAGVYRIRMAVTDGDGGVSNEQIFEYVVVYDPEGGFVTGGGWIDSPPGAYVSDLDLTGKATFGFVSRYRNGANTPSGNTEFQFKAAAFTFESSSYQWLVVSGARAQFKGEGMINGSGTYKFLLTTTDGEVNGGGGVDRFRIKITDLDDNLIYDNVAGASDQLEQADPQAITRGNIVIHK